MQWEEIGSYLDRSVRIRGLRLPAEVPGDSGDLNLMDSELMLCFQHELPDGDEETTLFRRIGLALPLAVKIYGPGSAELFGRMVEHFDAERPLLHIMTGRCYGRDVGEAVEDFFGATWPSEERFDDWRSYSILVFGDVQFCDKVIDIARSVVCRV